MDYRNELGNWEEIYLEPSGDTLPIGAITEFGGETAPTNWLFCNGQAVSRETYSELFSVIGTTYGDGDGSTTFNVPDFSSRSPMGVGNGTDGTNSETTTLGQEKGEYKHKLTVGEMPEHSHNIGREGAILFGGNRAYFSSAGSISTWASNDAPSHTSTKGESQAHNTIHPVLGVNYIIKAKQSIGIVGTVSEDITDTNNNAVPTCETVKGYVDEKQTYSTDEIVVGKWIDGKPLYRKVLTGKLPTGAGNNDFNFPNCNIHKVEGFVKSRYNSWFPIIGRHTAEVQYDIYLWFNNDKSLFTINCGSFYTTNSDYEITVLYTKTTD